MKIEPKDRQQRVKKGTTMRQIAHCPLGHHVLERYFSPILRVAFVSFVMLLCLFPSLHAQVIIDDYLDTDHFIFYYENGTSTKPGKAKDAYIINSSGDVLQKWTGGTIIAPEGAPGYLLPNGLLLRGIEAVDLSGDKFQVGAYGILQMVDKNDNVVWEYNGCSWPEGIPETNNRPYCLHHDIEPMPNGNILASVHVVYTEDDAIAELGFTYTGQGKVTMEEIWEIRPDMVNGGGEVVWKWKIVDHLVQDANPGFPNEGDVSDPGKFDINCVNSKSTTSVRQNGNHINMNGISYNPDRDQILFSSMKSCEVYIIDHNLTTEEAATSSGDFKWRWGTPKNYDYGGGSATTYSSWKWTKGQHDPRWIVDGNGNLTGNITIHNNKSTDPAKKIVGGSMFDSWTEAFELTPPYDGNGGYTRADSQPFGPASPIILAEYNPDLPHFNDGFASGVQKMPNGHVFSGSTPKFTLLEHDENGNIVWYFDCIGLTPGGGQFWKPFKYPVGYAGFVALGITEGVTHTVTFDEGTNGSRTGGGALAQTVVQGAAAIEPGITANQGYTFTGWDVAFDNITSDLTVTAQYSVVAGTQILDVDLPAGISLYGYTGANPVDTLTAFQSLIDSSQLSLVRWVDPTSGQIKELYYTTFPSAGWINEIGDLTLGQGYVVKTTASCTLSISGNKSTANVSQDLPAGYSIIGFNQETPMDAETAFEGLVTAGKLELVRWVDPSNGQIKELFYTTFPSAGWVNEIGNLTEGQGYIIKLNASHAGFVIP